MKQSKMIRAALYIGVFAFAIACTVGMLSTCSSELIEDIQDDITAQKEKDALEEEEGKTPETRIPVINVFAWSAVEGGKTDNPTVAFNLSAEAKAVSTSGAATIAGYFLKENTTAPAITDAGWLSVAPTSYEFSAEVGERNLYLWVKDSLGNLSSGSALAVTLEPLGWATGGVYTSGLKLPAHEQFIFPTNDVVVAEGATVSGIGTGTVEVGSMGKVVTVKPASLWSAGEKTLTLSVKTQYGLTLTKELNVTLFNGVCVIPNGNDSGNGSFRQPKATISAAISTANNLYGSGGALVKIAKGNYTVDGGGTSGIVMVEGISLMGEYSATFQEHLPGMPLTTVITDSSTTGGTDPSPIAAVKIPSSVTSATTLSYLKIQGGTATFSAAVFCDGSSPRIRNCQIVCGGNGAVDDYRNAIFLTGNSSPEIASNSINYDEQLDTVCGGYSTVKNSYGIRLYYVSGTNGKIYGNRLSGGEASSRSIGIYIINASASGKIAVYGNTIQPSNSVETRCIENSSQMTCLVYNNLLLVGLNSASASTVARGIVINNASAYFAGYNNTIVLGYPQAATSEYGITLMKLAIPTIPENVKLCNNLFVFKSGASTVCGINKATGASILELHNNGFQGFGAGKPMYMNTTTEYATIDAMETFVQGDGGLSSGNIAGGFSISDHFTLSVVNSQGLDGTSQGWGFSDDFFGTARTAPWSIGYHEKD